MTRDEAAARAGLSPDVLDRAWLAVGLPERPTEGPAVAETDIVLLQAFAAGVELLGLEATLQFGRVMGSSLAPPSPRSSSTSSDHLSMGAARPFDIAKASEHPW